jgi:hypothetical protein
MVEDLFAPQWEDFTLYIPPHDAAFEDPSLTNLASQAQWELMPNDANETAEQQRYIPKSPRVQCFDHGCDGYAFSSRENYPRHAREINGKGATQRSTYGLKFLRRSNRDEYVLQGKCPK